MNNITDPFETRINNITDPLEARITALESRVAKLVQKLDRKEPQPVAKPRRSPVEIVRQRLALYDPTPNTFSVRVLESVLEELKQEGYE